MNGRQLYEHLKKAITFFGLAFHEMDLIQIDFDHEGISFIYENKKLTVYVNETGAHKWKLSKK